MTTPINTAITIFSGFLQKLGSPGSGMVGIRRSIEEVTCGKCDVRVGLYPWNTDASDVAESLWRDRPQDGTLQSHVVVGYSYGGDRAVKFVRELEKRGDCAVKCLLLCDAVKRFDLVPGVAAWSGMGSLVVPAVTERCIFYVQKHLRWWWRMPPNTFQPAGHNVVPENKSATVMDGPHVRKSTHSYIDNDSGFRLKVLAEVGRLFQPTL